VGGRGEPGGHGGRFGGGCPEGRRAGMQGLVGQENLAGWRLGRVFVHMLTTFSNKYPEITEVTLRKLSYSTTFQ